MRTEQARRNRRLGQMVMLAWLLTAAMAASAQAVQGDAGAAGAGFALKQLWAISDTTDGSVALRPGNPAIDAADGSTPVEAMRFSEAQEWARQKSYVLGASQSKSQVAYELSRAALSGLLPSVEIRVGAGHETSTPSSRLDTLTGQPLPTSSQSRGEAYAVLSQPLFDLAAVAELRRARSAHRASLADEVGVRGDLGYELTASYFGAIEASLALKLTQNQLDRLNRLWNWVSSRADAGGASVADRERIRARMLSAQASVEDATAQLTQAGLSLRRLTGVAPHAVVLPDAEDAPGIASLEDALTLVSSGNAAVVTAMANEETAREERRAQLARFSPTVKFELSNSKSKNSGGIMGWKEDKRAMVILSMPLFSGGGDYFRQRAALARQEQYAFERQEAERSARHGLEVAFNGLTLARQKIDSLRHQAQAQARVVQAFDAQLNAASRNLLDVFDAYQQYHQSQMDLLRTCVQAILLNHQVLRLTGQWRVAEAGTDTKE
ncbi:TolC family protein [Hydrogenophaga sp.]|uniref:TolC family protein n=1 Tax=Hydrogenophaga sp. TaxID=1904254 RepID=UPI002609E399|nr:TolC family protein [Hydrogenophaga sp.]MCW5655257.1 TolC family protein [Hydrogenophaga sp.]